MPNSVGLNITPLHMKFVEPNDTATPLAGTLSFTPNPIPILFPDQNVIVAGTESVVLDENGEATIDLVSTDNLNSNPLGWVYSVIEKLIGARQRTYNIVLPFTDGAIVELSDIEPTDAAPQYLPVVGPQGPPGIVTSVNGYSQQNITLTSADVGALSNTDLGVANGVASLDANAQLPRAQLTPLLSSDIPDLSSAYLATGLRGTANGVASLNASALVDSTQLSLSTSVPPGVGTGAVGTSTNLARADHTHDGTQLNGDQTLGGNKTYTGNLQMAMLGVGVVPGTELIHGKATVDETVLFLEQTAASLTTPVVQVTTGDVTSAAVALTVGGDTANRFSIGTDGKLNWGSGSASPDTNLSRASAGVLTTSGQIISQPTAPTAAGHLTRKDYVDNNFVSVTGGQTVSGAKVFTGAPTFQGSSSGASVEFIKVSGDANPRLTVGADGTFSWGPGNAVADITLSRTSGASLSNSSNYQSQRTATTLAAYTALLSGDTFNRFQTYADGKMEWGPGNVARDTNLYRSAANTLSTDDTLSCAGLHVGGRAYWVREDWTPLSSVGTFQSGFSAGSPIPKIRQIINADGEVWEFSGTINVASMTGNTTNTVFIFNTGNIVTSERGFQCYASKTLYYGMRVGFLANGNMTAGVPNAVGTITSASFNLDNCRICNPYD